MDYHVYTAADQYPVGKFNSEKEARAFVEKSREQWRTCGSPRIPAHRIIWNRDGSTIAEFPAIAAG